MSLRDDLLPVVDSLRQLPNTLGVSRYAVTIRRRSWSGGAPGLGNATDTDTVLTPSPNVRVLTSKEVADSGGTYREGDFRVFGITPAYSGSTSGGYTPAQLDPRPNGPQEDVCYLLTGDDGIAREAQLVKLMTDKPFGYELVLRLIRPGQRG